MTNSTRFLSAYILYKQETYLIADVRGHKLLIISKDGTKLQVLKNSIKVYPNWRVAEIEYKNSTYWVTKRGKILSTSTFKWVWAKDSPTRKGILAVSSAAWEAKALTEVKL